MDLGFALPVSGGWATPDAVLTIARRAEDLGYTTLWTFQRLLSPATVPMEPVYRSVLDPLVALGYAAAVTDRVRLGTAVVNLPFLSPAMLGKQLATLDVLSRGRVVAGLGLGWVPEEFVAVGTPYERRGARAEEYVACLRSVWGPDPVSFSGQFYEVPPAEALPKPVQQPGPPVLLGGTAPAALERAGRLADGWISSSRTDPQTLGASVATVKEAAGRAGRDPGVLRFVCRGVVLDAPRTRLLTGSLDQVLADVPLVAEQGITELFVDLNFDPAVGHPDVGPEAALRRALDVMDALAPAVGTRQAMS